MEGASAQKLASLVTGSFERGKSCEERCGFELWSEFVFQEEEVYLVKQR